MIDLLPAAEKVAALLRERKHTVAVAEASAGGLISAALLAVPGASDYFLGGAVVYTAKARGALLQVPGSALEGMRPSTEPYALLLAGAVRERMGATWGIAETGAAGPTGNRYGDAAGHACFGIAGPINASRTLETAQPDRAPNMHTFARAALELLADTLANAPQADDQAGSVRR